MKTYLKHLLLVLLAVISVVSCIDGTLAEPDAAGGNRYLNSLDAQAALIEATVSDIRDLQETLEEEDSGLSAVLCGLEEHAATLKAGTNWSEGTLATLDHQKSLASAIGILGTHAKGEAVEAIIAEIEESAVMWLGKNFKSYYPAVAAQAKAGVLVSDCSRNIAAQKIHVEGIASDIEAGLKEGVASEEVEEVASSLDKVMTDAEELIAFFASVVSEVETAYQQALATAIEEPGSFDSDALSSVNKTASVDVKSGEVNLNELIGRVQVCEERLDDIESRLSVLEGKLEDIDGLLNMIQSVTFMSDYSEEYAVAYYSLLTYGDRTADGSMQRKPESSITLKYIVRPASAAAALTEQSLWNDEVKVFGYYAQKMTKASSDMFDYNIRSISSDASTGLLTITVDNVLSSDFFFKNTGAKLALSVANGKTDITSKFVEVVPKDISPMVYVESIKLSKESVEIDNGESLKLSAVIAPANADNQSVVWTSSNQNVVFVSGDGTIDAKSVGTATITATSVGYDEWGKTVSAKCVVKVNEAVRLTGAPYVEEGKTSQLFLDYPPSMIIESKRWETSDASKATVDDNGVVTAVANTYAAYTHLYNDVTITCTINSMITVSHNIKVVVPQPKSIKIADIADNQSSVTIKVDNSLSLASTIAPDNVDASKFRFMYQSDQGLGWINSSSGIINEHKHVMDPCAAWVYIDVLDISGEYYFAPGESLRRTLVVNVEPYWVKGLSFASSNITLEPGQTTTLTPTFISDVAGKQPTYTDLKWVSSNPNVVSVNETTGEITTKDEGSAQITATTNHDWSVPSGSSQLSATCSIVVEKPTAPVNIGDYYYSDGTWSSTRDNSKTVIGIVFAKASPATADKNMMADYPKCTHGLVVALPEYNSKLGEFGYSSVYGWLTDNGYEVPDTSKPNGYGLTKGLTAYRAANSGYCDLFDSVNGPAAKHNNGVTSPSGASSWYIPSFRELQLLHENKAVVNTALNAAGGTQVTGSMYWSSTFRTYNSYNDCQGSPFDMINGGWYSYDKKTTEYPVRVVLAF